MRGAELACLDLGCPLVKPWPLGIEITNKSQWPSSSQYTSLTILRLVRHKNLSWGHLKVVLILVPTTPHMKREQIKVFLPPFTMSSCHHKFFTYEKSTTVSNIALVSGDFQIGHVGTGVWLGLNATDNLPWNRKCQVLRHRVTKPSDRALGKENELKAEATPHSSLTLTCNVTQPLHASFLLAFLIPIHPVNPTSSLDSELSFKHFFMSWSWPFPHESKDRGAKDQESEL